MLGRLTASLVLASVLAGCTSGQRGGSGSLAAPATAAPSTAPAAATPTPVAASLAYIAPTPAPAKAPAPAPQGSLTLDVEVPTWTSSGVYVALDQPVNGKPAWTPDAVALTKDAQGRYVGTIPVPAGSTVSWKVTRGSWATVEKGPSGEELPNRKNAAGSDYAHVFHWGDDQILPPAGNIRDLGVFTPRVLGTPRNVYAHLPPGYDDPANAGKTYPVLYALDGQNMFDPSRSFSGVVWGLDVASDAHAAAGMSPFICVAIDNTPARIDEYTPVADPQYGGGKLEEFASFLFGELKPAMDVLYRTKPGPDDTCVLGSSLGGIATYYMGFKHPDQTRVIGAISPSFWWDNQCALAMTQATKPAPPLTRLRVDIGTNEGSDPQTTLDQTRSVAAVLAGMGFGNNFDYEEYAGASHDETSWAARLPDILAFLFP
jgi:pullulanase